MAGHSVATFKITEKTNIYIYIQRVSRIEIQGDEVFEIPDKTMSNVQKVSLCYDGLGSLPLLRIYFKIISLTSSR
jgi:hypothetical protein